MTAVCRRPALVAWSSVWKYLWKANVCDVPVYLYNVGGLTVRHILQVGIWVRCAVTLFNMKICFIDLLFPPFCVVFNFTSLFSLRFIIPSLKKLGLYCLFFSAKQAIKIHF